MSRRNRSSSRIHALGIVAQTQVRNGSCDGGSQEHVVSDGLIAIPQMQIKFKTFHGANLLVKQCTQHVIRSLA